MAVNSRRKARLRAKTLNIVSRAVEEGVAFGLQRYNKYNDEAPIEIDVAAEHIEREVINALCEVIDFES